MAQSVQYVTWSQSGHVRLEIIQVDNGASHVNVSCNFQVGPDFGGAGGLEGDWESFNGYGYSGTLTAGGTTISFSGANGDYPTSPPYGFKSIATKWIGTIPRSAGTFRIIWNTFWRDTVYQSNQQCQVDSGNIAIMAYVAPNAKDALSNYSTATLGSVVTFTITNSTSYAHTDSLTYSLGSATGTIQSGISVPANSTKNVSWTPPASLGAQISTAFSGTATLTLTTTGQGAETYSCQVKVPTYTYSMSAPTVSKVNYTAIGGTSYVALKHTARFKAATFPAAQYGATLAGEFNISAGGSSLYQAAVASGGTVDYTHGAAATVTGTCRVTDSRGVGVSKSVSTTWVANPSVSCTFTAKRSGSSTTINLIASGTYSSSISGLGATITISKSGTTVQTAAGAGGSASLSTTDTLALASSQQYECSMTDTLGNSVTKRVTVPAAFFYLQVGGGANGHGVSIGRAASTTGTDLLEIGLPTTIDHYIQPAVYKAFLGTDTASVAHSQDTIIHAPHVGFADVGCASTDTLAVKLKALTRWLRTNYASNSDVYKSRCVVTGTFAGKSNGVASQNMTYIVMFYDLSQIESGGDTAPRYSGGIAWSVVPADQLFFFGNSNGTFNVYQIKGTAYTS